MPKDQQKEEKKEDDLKKEVKEKKKRKPRKKKEELKAIPENEQVENEPKVPETVVVQEVAPEKEQEKEDKEKDKEEEDEELEDEVEEKNTQSIGKEATRQLLASFDDETLDRYEAFRRAHLPKAQVRKMVSNLVGPVPSSVAIVVAGVGKVFVGEIVESALDVMDEWGHKGPICPIHLREAFKRYQERTKTVRNRLHTRQIFA